MENNIAIGMWAALAFGVVPLLGWLLWWWNDIWYGLRVKARCSASCTKLPPGHMGVPFFGELISFLWYFKFLGRPDEFIDSKRRRYGDQLGIYKTHLFGSPSIITCSPSLNKFVFQSDTNFGRVWPSVDLLGSTSLVTVEGAAHTRLRGFLSRAINEPNALRRVALRVQPRIVSALSMWAEKRRINGFKETNKVTFESIGELFASIKPGPALDSLDELFTGLGVGYKAHPINFPGTAYHYAIQCRKKAVAIFREELEKRKKKNKVMNVDLMDGLMQMKDDEGKQLSDMEVIDNIVSFISGGHESTTLAFMWALYYLAKYPLVLQKLREENVPFSKNKNGEFVTMEEVAKLKYTNKIPQGIRFHGKTEEVVEEIIRLANIATFVFRTANKDVEYKGYTIPKGWKVILWLRYVHTDPKNYQDPLCFNPDRWNESANTEAYQVFGGGAKICAGNMFARLQLAIFVHHLTAGYKWELINPDGKMSYLPYPKPVDGLEISISKLQI